MRMRGKVGACVARTFEILSRLQGQMARLEPLMHPLLTEEVVGALHGKQVYSVLDFVEADTQQIIKIARLNFKEVRAVKNFLLKKFSAAPINGFDCYKTVRNNAAIIPTGIKGTDHLLDGGFFTGNIYEICGLPAAGKTWFVLSLMKNLVCTTNQRVYLFDTKSDFSGVRMKNMLRKYDQMQQEKFLSKIIVSRAFTKHDLINGLYGVKDSLEENSKLRLIIIDSLSSILLNSNDYIATNAYLNHLINVMRYMTTEHHVAILITNLITTWSDSDFKIQQNTVTNIACGKYWFGVPNTRLKIEMLEKKGMCRMTVLSSDTLFNKNNKSADFQFTEEGSL